MEGFSEKNLSILPSSIVGSHLDPSSDKLRTEEFSSNTPLSLDRSPPSRGGEGKESHSPFLSVDDALI